MKILVLSESGYGAWFAWLFKHEGHKVSYVVKPKYKDILAGIAPLTGLSLPLVGELNKFDLVMFDMTGNGKLAQKINALGVPVIGDSVIADLLEDNRTFGIKAMEDSDILVPLWHSFQDIKTAAEFVRKNKKRYVFKPSGDDQDCAATYVSTSAEDLLEYFSTLTKITKGTEFILQEVVEGIEISTEAFFNGQDWCFINNTFEEKKFMNSGLGPNTGCSGNLVYSHGIDEPKIFKQGLKKLESFLKIHNYKGMIDLNCIVSNNKLYGLEWTPRFGYDASPTQTLLVKDGYANFLGTIACGEQVNADLLPKGFAASVRLSIPPYPLVLSSELAKLDPKIYQSDIPINGFDLDNPNELASCYMYDVRLNKLGHLVSCGHEGFICCPSAVANNPFDAFEQVKAKIARIKIPNVQYRTDIAKKTIERYEKAKAAGWFSYSFS